MPLDLTAYSDRDVLFFLGKEKPDFVDIVSGWIDAGRTDDEIIHLVAAANGSGQAMHYTKKLCRALRSL